jgi:hypothetical protein
LPKPDKEFDFFPENWKPEPLKIILKNINLDSEESKKGRSFEKLSQSSGT